MTTLTDQASEYPDEINKAYDRTGAGESSVNNCAIDPEMTYTQEKSSLSELTNRVTVIEICDSEEEAKQAVAEIEQQGLLSSHISIIAKDYQEPQSTLNWKNINAEGGLEVTLTRLGISKPAIAMFVEAIDNGKFLMIESGSDRASIAM
ncbi:MAG: hypothetical protein ACK5C4_00755 [Pseudanabaena sp.]|jgi:hypothetical protein